MNKIDDLKYKTLLFDFYGSLLTDKQRDTFTSYYFEDMTMIEISEKLSISKAAVSDNLKNTFNLLEKYETNLSMIKKHLSRIEIFNKKPENSLELLEEIEYE